MTTRIAATAVFAALLATAARADYCAPLTVEATATFAQDSNGLAVIPATLGSESEPMLIDTSSAISEISATIGTLNEIATSIASAVGEQGSATQEIARNVQQAAVGTDEVSTNISRVTQSVSNSGQASTEVLSAADELTRQAERLRGDVDGFLAKIRAA